ncbi:MAG: S8 family serine peptidase [Flavobacteriales bacterium]|nr:S8 family serine peptidase [Flavobacteriales bacterium]
MKILTSLVLLLPITLFGQEDAWERIIAEKVPADLPMSAMLYQLARLDQEVGRDAALAKAAEFEFLVRPGGAIYVEAIMHDHDHGLTGEEVRALGMDPELIWRYIASAYVPFDQLIPLARRLNGLGMLQHASMRAEDFEGRLAQNVDGYHTAGKDGAGITIGLIDRNYGQLTSSINAGQAPTDIDTLAFPAGNVVEVSTANAHGTGCLEALYDNAPGASYVVCRIIGDAAFGTAVDSLLARNVQVISTSSAGYNKGWADDSGPWCDAWNDACNAGVLCFNSAGNSAMQHWQGAFNNNGNGTHQWSGNDTTNTFTLGPSSGVEVFLQWASTNPGDQYDLFLYQTSNNALLASSIASSGFESLSFTNPSSTINLSVYLLVRANVASPPQFEVFASQQNLTYQVAASSTRSPSNCTHVNSLSVGAVDWSVYGSAPGSTVIQNYSSQGPTNSGNQAPDLCGPTNTTGSAYPGPNGFGGTSCATPNAAGAAAALWSALPDYSADGIRMVLLRLAELHKDWGPAGTDMIYGYGGLYLNEHHPFQEYIHADANNTNGASDIPYSSIEQADQYAPVNSNVTHLGGTYQEPPPGTVLDKPAIYRSVQENAVVE